MSADTAPRDPDPGKPVPEPRQAWRAAKEGRRIAITVQPDSRSVSPSVGSSEAGGVVITGEVAGREKVGDPYTVSATIRVHPDGDLVARLELEAVKEAGEWTAYRAFSYEHARGPDNGIDGAFRYIGRVTGMDILDSRAREVGHADL